METFTKSCSCVAVQLLHLLTRKPSSHPRWDRSVLLPCSQAARCSSLKERHQLEAPGPAAALGWRCKPAWWLLYLLPPPLWSLRPRGQLRAIPVPHIQPLRQPPGGRREVLLFLNRGIYFQHLLDVVIILYLLHCCEALAMIWFCTNNALICYRKLHSIFLRFGKKFINTQSGQMTAVK